MHSGIIPSEQILLYCENMNLYWVLQTSGKLSDLFLSVFLLFLCSFDCQKVKKKKLTQKKARFQGWLKLAYFLNSYFSDFWSQLLVTTFAIRMSRSLQNDKNKV